MSKFIEVTRKESGKKMYMLKASVRNVYEIEGGSYIQLKTSHRTKNGQKIDYERVNESFEVIQAMLDFDPAVADIVKESK